MRPHALLPSLFCILLGCGGPSPEAQVRSAFEACVEAVEAGDAAEAASRLSPRFEGPDGMDAGTAKLYLLGVLRREKVGVTVFSDRVEVRGTQARQTVELLLTGRGEGSLLPQDATRRRFLLRWERREGEWRLRELRPLEGGN